MVQRLNITTGQVCLSPANQSPGWAFLRFSCDLDKYYLWLYSRGNKKWNSCLNGCHATFIAGDREVRIVSEKELEPYIGQNVRISYDHTIWTNGKAFWLQAFSQDLENIRTSLGLAPRKQYHITLGNNK